MAQQFSPALIAFADKLARIAELGSPCIVALPAPTSVAEENHCIRSRELLNVMRLVRAVCFEGRYSQRMVFAMSQLGLADYGTYCSRLRCPFQLGLLLKLLRLQPLKGASPRPWLPA